jgi:hypothetical protein
MSKVTKQVVVGGVETKSGETNGRKWRRFSLKDDSDKFVGSTFSSTVGSFLQAHEGQRIEVELDEKQGSEGATLRDLVDAREITAGAGGEVVNDDAVVAALNRIAVVLEKLAAREEAHETFDPDAIPFQRT